MTNPKLTELVIVMDRSGSMASIKNAMEEGFTQFMAEQRKIPDPCNVTFYRFNTQVERVFQACPLNDVGPMALEPRGGTALLDAMGTAITGVGARLSATPEEQRPGKVIVVVITDGMENASKEYAQERISELVKHQTEHYNWQFAFLGANIDSFAVASRMGIAAAGVMNYTADAQGAGSMYVATSEAVGNYRSSNAKGAKLNFKPKPASTNKAP